MTVFREGTSSAHVLCLSKALKFSTIPGNQGEVAEKWGWRKAGTGSRSFPMESVGQCNFYTRGGNISSITHDGL